MGYKRGGLNLVFKDPGMEGLEINIRRPSIDDALAVEELRQLDRGQWREALGTILKRLAKAIRTWNLEDDDDVPIPPSESALQELDIDFLMALMDGWVSATVTVPDPLERPSPSGESVQELSLPMEILSESPPNSDEVA